MQLDLGQYKRDERGVRIRADGGGDAWALAHRNLGTGYHMHDIDTIFGFHAFGSNTGESLFQEYEPDNYDNRGSIIRSFAVIAMFDRKKTEYAAFSPENKLSLAFYLHQCRVHAKSQSHAPRFFLVIGGQTPPWEMIELNINDGLEVCRKTVTGQNMREVWDALGLSNLRLALRRFILGAAA